MIASFSGRCSRSGSSPFSPDFQYFALQICGQQILRESLEVLMGMKDLVYCRSALTGNIFHQVGVPPVYFASTFSKCGHTLTTSFQSLDDPSESSIFQFYRIHSMHVNIYSRLGLKLRSNLTFQGLFSLPYSTTTSGTRRASPSCVLF